MQSTKANQLSLDGARDLGAPVPAARRRGRRRGAIYAVVLGIAILVSLIGLSAVAVGRVNLRVASAGGDGADAQMLAPSAGEPPAPPPQTHPHRRGEARRQRRPGPLTLGPRAVHREVGV